MASFGGIKSLFSVAAPVLGALAGSFIPGVGPVLGPAIGAFAGGKLAGNSTTNSLIGAGIAGLGGYLASGSAAAQAGGYQNSGNFLGIGGSGPSLGSAVWNGIGSQGIGSLFQGASGAMGGAGGALSGTAAGPVATGSVASSGGGAGAGAASNGVTGATGAAGASTQADRVAAAMETPQFQTLTSKGLSAEKALDVMGVTGKAQAGGGALGGIGQFAANNPLLTMALIGGGSYALGLTDPPKATPPARGPSGVDLYRSNPGQYGFNNRNFMASGGHVSGPGGDRDDTVPAMLSDGEFVMTAPAVRALGGGDRRLGAYKMLKMMKQLEAMDPKMLREPPQMDQKMMRKPPQMDEGIMARIPQGQQWGQMLMSPQQAEESYQRQRAQPPADFEREMLDGMRRLGGAQ